MAPPALPQQLAPFRGPIPPELSRAAVDGLGERAAPVRALVEAGIVPPDVLTGMTLHLLASQGRRAPREEGGTRSVRRGASEGRRSGAIEGGVWVREQVTYHAPMKLGEPVSITGASVARFTRRGRRYGVTRSETRGADGRLLVSSCTTGLLAYRKDGSLPDERTGLSEDAIAVPGADATAAASNPHREGLRALRVGDGVETPPVAITLQHMRLRDAGRGDNRIHTDPEVARRAGLAAPIAGGSHVLAHLQAALMDAWGAECLLHGAHFDVRWVGQTRAGDRVTPRAVVLEATPLLVACGLTILGEERPVLEGTLALPLGGRAEATG